MRPRPAPLTHNIPASPSRPIHPPRAELKPFPWLSFLAALAAALLSTLAVLYLFFRESYFADLVVFANSASDVLLQTGQAEPLKMV